MPRPTFREQLREEPRQTLGVWAVTFVLYGIVAALRPRWLTHGARHPWRSSAWGFSIRAFGFWLAPRARAYEERHRRAREELDAELGRAPTDEEQWARMEELKDRS